MSEEIRFDQDGLKELLSSTEGDVARDLLKRGERVETAAKLNATGKEYGDGTRGPRVQTGRLRTSIATELGRDAQGLFIDVGTNVEYAPYLENGTDRMPAYPFLGPALQAGLD